MSKITPDEVRRLAALANIGLEDSQVESLASELDQIVDFVEQLQKVDTSDVEPTDQVTGLVDVWRPDEVRSDFTREELLANAPDQQDGFIKVRRVLNND
jgi:aspartyl-tRNA(Asn)/glutamyl-tRNA(Gln) amidotransferase subunit C